MDVWIPIDLIKQAAVSFKTLKSVIHGDVIRNSLMAHPTHSHGLIQYGLPEIFINHSAYGPEGNCFMIKTVSVGLMLNKSYLKKFNEDGFIEMRTGVYETEDPILCLRKVPLTFLAVIKAYQPIEMSIVGHAQLYVKGDDHVLKDEYFEGIPTYE